MEVKPSKKLFKFIYLGILLSFLIIVSVFSYVQINKSYTKIIDTNWSIKLPNLYRKIYYIDSGSSFHGDGQRYTILKYTKEDDINKSVNWKNIKDKSIETEINKVLSTLNIPKENMPNFQSNYKYYTAVKHDSSKIYLLFFNDIEKLYVIEDIY